MSGARMLKYGIAALVGLTSVIAIAGGSSLSFTPPIIVAVTVSDRASERLKRDHHPICLSLVLTGRSSGDEPSIGLGKEVEQCVLSSGTVRFGPQPYSRWSLRRIEGPIQLDIIGSSFNRKTFRNDYNCTQIWKPLSQTASTYGMNCDLLDGR